MLLGVVTSSTQVNAKEISINDSSEEVNERMRNSEGWKTLQNVFKRRCLNRHPDICKPSREVSRIRGMLETYCGLPDVIPFEVKKVLIKSDLDTRAAENPSATYSALKILEITNIDCYKAIGYPTEELRSRF